MRTGLVLQQLWRTQATIGFLGATSPKIWREFVASFEQGLRDHKWINGANITIKYEWADGKPQRYASIAKKFVRDGVDVIVTSGTQPALAAKHASRKTPIVFASAGAPANRKVKLVNSLERPGGNVTGLSNGASELAGRRIDELRKLVPGLQELAIMGNRGSALIRVEMDKVRKEARARGLATASYDVRAKKDIGPAISAIKKKQIQEGGSHAIFVCTDPFITTNQGIIHAAALNAGLPTVHGFRDYVEAGGLMSYGPDFRAMFFQAAEVVDKILRGKKPGDIPVKMQKSHELVINPDVAHALSLRIPKGIRKRADFTR
jgi:putative ABC transport system substrate-binding protein